MKLQVFIKSNNGNKNYSLIYETKNEDLLIESLSHDLGERGFFIEEVIYLK